MLIFHPMRLLTVCRPGSAAHGQGIGPL